MTMMRSLVRILIWIWSPPISAMMATSSLRAAHHHGSSQEFCKGTDLVCFCLILVTFFSGEKCLVSAC
uniref:Secreted protein n=1 Tax=Oryza meridionalis TaxID=40149 RepID=A0A0E0D243_9ORYZ